MAWPKRDTKHIKIPIYDQDIHVFRTKAAFEKALDHLGMENVYPSLGGLSLHCEGEDGSALFLVAIFVPTMQVLVHELAHVTFDVLNYVGVSTHHGEQEPYCYLLDHLFEECWEFVHGSNARG